MRTLVIAAVATVMSIVATPAEAQRIGPRGNPPPRTQMPMPLPPHPMPMPNPAHPANGQWHGGGQWHGNNGGQWHGGQHQGGQWNGGQWHGNNGGQWQGGGQVPGNNGGQWQSGGQWNGNNGGQWHGNTGGQWNGYQSNGRSRWGNRIGGFWWAGVQAPGGWSSYVRLKRGRHLPSYWLSPNYVISDWQLFGLGAPPSGYYWSRYYNDAVLIDGNGMIYDSIGDVDWDRYQGGYAYDDEYQGGGYAYGEAAGYPAPQGPGPGYGAPYPAPGGYDSSSSSSHSYSYTAEGGYAGGPPPMSGPMPRIPYGNTYYTAPGTVTTIVIPGAVTTTTTTTEIVEQRRYVAPRRVVVVRRVVVRRWHPRPKPRCSCSRPAPILGS